MIDASKGFLKDGNKNRLRSQDIHKIVDVFTRQTELPRYSRMVPLAEIASPANDYNLNIPRYIDSTRARGPAGPRRAPERRHPGPRHRRAGRPTGASSRRCAKALFQENGRAGYSEPRVEPRSEVKATILGHPSSAFAERVASVFEGWRAAHEPRSGHRGRTTGPAS